MILPAQARPRRDAPSPASTPPARPRLVIRLGSAALAAGRRTVAHRRRAAAPLTDGHRTPSQRAPPPARWPAPRLAWRLARVARAPTPTDQAGAPAGDGSGGGPPGRTAHGRARHRGPVRSGHGVTARRDGHEWAALAVLARSPRADRPRAPPVPAGPYRGEQDDRPRHRPRRTPARVATTPLRGMPPGLPEGGSASVGDSGSGAREMARFARRHGAHPAPASELHPGADLLGPPPPHAGEGRPPVGGRRRPGPKPAGAGAGLPTAEVARYGGGRRGVAVAAGAGRRYEAGAGPAPRAWAPVKGRTGTRRDEPAFPAAATMAAVATIEAHAGRWDPGAARHEARCSRGPAGARGRGRRTVLRAAPGPFGLDTAAARLYRASPEAERTGRAERPGAAGAPASGALACVRRRRWRGWVTPQAGGGAAGERLGESLHPIAFQAPAPAA